MRARSLPFVLLVALFLALHVALAVWLTRASGTTSAARSTAVIQGHWVVSPNPRAPSRVSARAVHSLGRCHLVYGRTFMTGALSDTGSFAPPSCRPIPSVSSVYSVGPSANV